MIRDVCVGGFACCYGYWVSVVSLEGVVGVVG